MHDMGVLWLRVASAFYAVGLLHAFLMVFRRRLDIFRVALPAFCAGLAFHVVSIVEFTLVTGRFPVNSFLETSSLCALLIALAFLFVYWQQRFASLSVFIFPLVFVMSLIGAMQTPVAAWPNSSLRDAWLAIHIVMILLGYAALLLTAVSSIFYLIQEKQIKNKAPNQFFDRLPPLATLDSLVTNSMSFGFVLITLGVIAGSGWAFIESGTAWIADPKIAISFATWAFYLLMVFLRTSAGWRGRKAALMAIVVLCCSAVTWAAHIGLRQVWER